MSAPTLDELIARAADELDRVGLDDPRHEARQLLQHAGGLSREDLIREGGSPAPPQLVDAFESLVPRRLAREPLQHILGWTDFYGRRFRSDSRALIPRSDSETLVDTALDQSAPETARVADLGTGTGCLLLTLLAERPQWTGEGVEASTEAAELARENAQALDVADRSKIVKCDWRDWIGWAEVDLIVSNPPYVATRELGSLQVEVRDHDPLGALDGGADGLDAYRSILTGAQSMRRGAWLLLEIGWTQAAQVQDLVKRAGFTDVFVRRDLGGRDRVVGARKGD